MAVNDRPDMYDGETGYTDLFYEIQNDIRNYSKFLAIFVRLDLLPVRHARILISNYSQRRFNDLRGEI